MSHHLKASTIVETLVASVVILTTFTGVFMLMGSLIPQTTLSRDYMAMRHDRDSILCVISESGIMNKVTLNREWGQMNVYVTDIELYHTQIEIVSVMCNGQTYKQLYLIDNGR